MTGLGTDIIEIARVRAALARPAFIRRVFTPGEQSWLSGRGTHQAECAAGLFCAKEAVAKALGTGFGKQLHLLDIEIGHAQSGAPYVVRPNGNFLLSISHCREYATATAVLMEGEAVE
ncbi:MAG TPA: holo-[acyl-carrier-protein] synthase [Clostridiales bacterium]|nr:holo-[acyl-carrier-protein] synthase [Clostridiales bacterium]